MDILEGRISREAAAVEQGLSVEEMEQWTTLYLAALRNAAVSKKRFSMATGSQNHKCAALVAAALVVLAVGGAFAAAADLNCPGGGLICFSPNTPAKASEVNSNFSKLADWIEKSVGPIDAPVLDSTVAGTTTVDGTLSADVLVGDLIQGNDGVVINGTNGAMSDLVIGADGNVTASGDVTVSGNTTVGGDANVTGNLSVTGKINGGYTLSEFNAYTWTDRAATISTIMTSASSSICFLTTVYAHGAFNTCTITESGGNWVLSAIRYESDEVTCIARCLTLPTGQM